MQPFEQKTIDALKWMTDIFNHHNIPYRIGGGLAAKIYGSLRPLNDIDFGIPEKYFSIILPEISQYITYGPARWNNDGKWDCDLITLNYHGQEIDISGTETVKIMNKEGDKWIPLKSSETLEMNIQGINVKVMSPNELRDYKKELNGEHQLVDIQAIENYLNTHKT